MPFTDVATRLVRPLGADEAVVWLDRDCRRYPPTTILRLSEREAVGWDGELRPDAPFELVVVREVRSQFSLVVDRAQFGTAGAAYPPGAFVDPIARSPLESERPDWRGYE